MPINLALSLKTTTYNIITIASIVTKLLIASFKNRLRKSVLKRGD